ncbi:MAG TPA: ABC transporter ATP-binding protein [Lachnospiraceae bacterium]|nr:ABC transporter ATP-binding protein [Lachnospiraceae bacterium]
MYLEVSNVKKSYGVSGGKQEVLKGVSCSLEKGDMASIIGSSGCGKSTLLNCIGALEVVDGGDITIDGKSVVGLNKKELARFRRDNIGYIFQFYNLIQGLNVRDNIRVAEKLTDTPLDYEELANALSLTGMERKYPSQLSGGQQQRVAIARALIKNPKLLLCDEPTGALDSATARETLILLEKVNAEFGTTILMVTHNQVIPEMMKKNFVMKDGSIVEYGINDNIVPAEELHGL